MPEVEPGILAVVLAAHPFGKEHAVRREAEVVVLLGEDARGLSLVAQLEGHALGLQVLYLLLDGELGLSFIIFCDFVHSFDLSCLDRDRSRGTECAPFLNYPSFRMQLRVKRRLEGAPCLHEPEHRLEHPADERPDSPEHRFNHFRILPSNRLPCRLLAPPVPLRPRPPFRV